MFHRIRNCATTLKNKRFLNDYKKIQTQQKEVVPIAEEFIVPYNEDMDPNELEFSLSDEDISTEPDYDDLD